MDYLYEHQWSTVNEIMRNISLIDNKRDLKRHIAELKMKKWIKSRARDSMLFGNVKKLGDYAKPHEYIINEDINRTINTYDIHRLYGSFQAFTNRRYK